MITDIHAVQRRITSSKEYPTIFCHGRCVMIEITRGVDAPEFVSIEIEYM